MKNSFTILITFVALSIIGAAFIPLLNIQLKPTRSLPNLSVSFSWYNASAKVIEQEATAKLEGVFSSIRGVENIKSTSNKGYGRITIEFKKGTDLEALRFEVATRIRQIYSDLPEELSYPHISLATGNENQSPILSYRVNAGLNPSAIQQTVKDVLLTDLSLIKGVGNVQVYGAMSMEWVITYDVPRLEALGISSSDISASVKEYFAKNHLGSALAKVGEKVNQQQLILKNSEIGELNWENIPIKNTGDRIIRLKELVSDISFKEKKAQSYYRINGLNTINLVVYPTKNVNTIRLAEVIQEKMDALKKNLPPSFSILKVYDASEDLEKELEKISLRAIFSLIILFLFVVLMTRKLNYLFLISISIVANLLIACIAYYFLGVEIQLYSLAGITISFGMVIDNSVIMIDHYVKTSKRNVFIPILAASLTTIGSLAVIFFLEEEQQVNLIDFAWVIIINLSVSLAIALFFIPALMPKIKIRQKKKVKTLSRINSFLERSYFKTVRFNRRFRLIYFLILVLAFGIPFHLLPEKMEEETEWANFYNENFGSEWFKELNEDVLKKWLGGTFYLFSEHVNEHSSYSEPQRTALYIRGSMPDGCSIHQLNDVIKKMENYLSRFSEIDMYQTSVRSYKNSQITVYFKPEFDKGSFPYMLKGMITSKAVVLGGLDWSVYGVGRGFNNSVGMGGHSHSIELEGYNFEQLLDYAEVLKKKLSKNSRVQDLIFKSTNWWDSKPATEYNLKFRYDQLAVHEHSLASFYQTLQEKLYQKTITTLPTDGKLTDVVLRSGQTEEFDIWHLHNKPLKVDKKLHKFESLATITKDKTGLSINKKNQQYSLAVAFNFTGPDMLARKVKEKFVDEMNDILPMGYKCKKPTYGWWDRSDKSQYWLILVIIFIIFLICSILFESFSQPFAIIGMIPISFIGVFLTFYVFEFNFDQGGFAAFVLLSGLTVNAGIYLVSEYNRLRSELAAEGIEVYIMAFKNKIRPVFLTIISTMLGLVPFIYSGQEEVFWFAFAVGSIGGLLFSFLAIVIYLPIMLKW